MENSVLYLDISIIIPCYNVEHYIEQCLNSIIKQNILPKEILCIDDGATDNTANIIKNLSQKHSYVKYIHQYNQGVSQARNTGLNLSTGKYIQFVDPDDILHPQLLYKFFDLSKKNEIELFYFENENFENSKDISFSNNKKDNLISFPSGRDLFINLVENKKYPGASWKYIFLKKILTIQFVGRNHEDHLITLNILLSAKVSYYSKHPLYYYRKRANSLTNYKNINKNYVVLYSNVINKCGRYISDKNLPTETKIQYINFLRSNYLFHINIYFLNKEKPPIIDIYVQIYKRLFIKNKLKTFNNIFFIISYAIKNKLPMKHFIIFLKAIMNKNINYMTKKINLLL